jgi:hypothetical protein
MGEPQKCDHDGTSRIAPVSIGFLGAGGLAST